MINAHTPEMTQNKNRNPFLGCSIKPEKIFLFFGLFFGIIFALLTPPFQVPDEQDHFYTAYAISQGQSRLEEASIPVPFVDLWTSVKDLRFNMLARLQWNELEPFLSIPLTDQQKQISLYNTRFYSSILYLPQAMGIYISKGLGLSALAVFWGGRLSALIFWLLIMYAGLRIAPTFKWVLMFLVLTPISLFEGASYSADCMTNAFSFLSIAILLKAASPECESINFKRAILLAASFTPLIFLKFPYITQIALLCLIPLRKYVHKRHFYFIILIAFLCLGLWFIRIQLLSGSSLFGTHQNTPGNLQQQMSFILSNPIGYLDILRNTLSASLGVYLVSFVGILGWIYPYLPLYIYVMYYFILIFLALADHRRDFIVQRVSKGILFATSITVFLGILTTLYLTWTRVGGPYVEGVSGRYFFPFAPLLILALYNRRYSFPKQALAIVASVSVFLILSVSCYCIFMRYYL